MYINFHEFCIHFNCSFCIKTTSRLCVSLIRVEVRSLVKDIKKKIIKVTIFKKKTFLFRILNVKVMKVHDFNNKIL